jgi:hypothetical protein
MLIDDSPKDWHPTHFTALPIPSFQIGNAKSVVATHSKSCQVQRTQQVVATITHISHVSAALHGPRGGNPVVERRQGPRRNDRPHKSRQVAPEGHKPPRVTLVTRVTCLELLCLDTNDGNTNDILIHFNDHLHNQKAVHKVFMPCDWISRTLLTHKLQHVRRSCLGSML